VSSGGIRIEKHRITATESEIAERKEINDRWVDSRRMAELDMQIRGINQSLKILCDARKELREESVKLQEKYRRKE